jgi:carbon storage regulator
MLVITRKSRESVSIGDDVVVTVLHVGGGEVRIGIDAPKQVRVLRTELLERMKELERAANKDCQPS